MSKEEILDKIKEKVDALSKRSYEILNNNEDKFNKSDFVMYCDVHNLFRDLDKLIERKNDVYFDFTMKYLNCMGHFQENKIKDFIDVSNEVRPLLENSKFIEEKGKELMDYIVIPGSYSETHIIPDLPEGAKAYLAQISNSTSQTFIKYEAKDEEILPFGNNEVVYNKVVSKLNDKSKLLGVGFGMTKVNKYKYTYSLIASLPTDFFSLMLQTTFQFEIEGKVLVVICSANELISKRIADVKTQVDNITIEDDKLLNIIMDEKLDSKYPNDAVCKFRQTFRDIIDIN